MDDTLDRRHIGLPLEVILDDLQDLDVLYQAALEETIRYDGEDAPEISSLPAIALRTVGSEPGLFEIGTQRLGAGGMGEVRLATQPALNRDVAIKIVKGSGTVTNQSRILMREALVMGYLEHPNIVPIHVLGRDDHGELVVAMKRIEGITLAEKLDRDDLVAAFETNIEVLIDVCKATGYAHDRGVVHLDIKPANIMIGPFGEVYLLDWGTAVAHRDDCPHTIPRPVFDGRVRGTLVYIAPETIAGEPPTTATDIYLLGGVLYAILTGKGPNLGDDNEEVMTYAYRCPPRTLPDHVPPDLVAIVNKALAREPADRYASAMEFADALKTYLSSRAARDILAAARRRRERFDGLIADEAPTEEIYAAFGVARQLLDDARRITPNPEEVRRDQQTLYVAMIEWELAQGNPLGAQKLLVELPDPQDDLRSLVEEAVAEREREIEELREFRREVDPNVANRQKIVLFATIGTVIGAIHLAPILAGYVADATDLLRGHFAYLAVLLGVTIGLRGYMFGTRTNRETIFLVWLLSLFGLCVRIGAATQQLGLHIAVALDLALVALIAAFGALALDRRVAIAPPLYAAFAGACLYMPDWSVAFFGIAHFIALLAVAGTFAALGPRS